jgi:hypothetical protein
LAEGHQADVRLFGHLAQGLLDGVHVDAAVPLLEVVADEQRRPVGGVGAFEACEVGVAGLGSPGRVHARVAVRVAVGLLVHDVVVHRQGVAGLTGGGVGERHSLQWEVPQARPLVGPDLHATG